MFPKNRKKQYIGLQIQADSGSEEATFVVAFTETVLEMRELAAAAQRGRTIAMH